MSETHSSDHAPESGSREDQFAALFGQLIMQQANMAMMLMGKVAHPDTGKTFRDVEAARLFIDELEMLEAKTKGNLSKEEAAFLKQTLMSLRLSYVEAVESPAATEPSRQPAEPPKPAAEPDPAPPPGASASAAPEEEHHKKFSKKY